MMFFFLLLFVFFRHDPSGIHPLRQTLEVSGMSAKLPGYNGNFTD